MILPDVEIEKIDHGADANAVDQVADDPARDQPQRQARARTVQLKGMTEQIEREHRQQRDRRQHEIIILKDAPRRAGVAPVDKTEEAADDDAGFFRAR